MKKVAVRKPRAKKPARRSRLVNWIVVAGVAGAIVYGVSQMSAIAYTDRDITAVDFSSLDAKQKRSALDAANRARCTCGCGMTLAQCVATDSTCPVRESNVATIKALVQQALRPAS